MWWGRIRARFARRGSPDLVFLAEDDLRTHTRPAQPASDRPVPVQVLKGAAQGESDGRAVVARHLGGEPVDAVGGTSPLSIFGKLLKSSAVTSERRPGT